MAEDIERPAPAGTGNAADGAALHAALSGASGSDEARIFLAKQSVVADKQARLLDLQIEDMKREDVVRHWSLRIHHISDVMKLAFEFAVAAILLGVVVLISAAVWSAVHDDGLVIEAFSVPPDMAARGLTGQAVAARLQDKLAAMQDATDSARPASSYANNWGSDIKVQIPDTGVSIGEFYRILVIWLGHQTHITGEVYRDAAGVGIVARAGGNAGEEISGKETDFDALIQQAAEAIYGRTQPYRYAVYLFQHGKVDQARANFLALTEQGPPRDRAWAWIGLSSIDEAGNLEQAPVKERKAISLYPDFFSAWGDLNGDEGGLAHDESSLAAGRKAVAILKSGDGGISERTRPINLAVNESNVAFELGDLAAALHFAEEAVQLPDYAGIVESSRQQIVIVQAMLHDPAAFRDADRSLPGSRDPLVRANRANTEMTAYYWLHDWSSVIARRSDVESTEQALPAIPGFTQTTVNVVLARQDWPYIATAMAMTGDIRGAHSLIDHTPFDCYACLRNRGDIDAADRNWPGANYWFARATEAAPSIPIAYSDWGAMLLAKGDIDGAVAKFTIAHEKGPHFADPLEMWGEALIAKNRSDLALAKFVEADAYAPNWGRLRLKWGEALLWSGKPGDARKQFGIASTLDLVPPEKSELARMRATHV